MIGQYFVRLYSRIRSRFVWETEPSFCEGYRPPWLGDEQVRAVRDDSVSELDLSGVTDRCVIVLDEPVEVYKAVREGIATLRLPRGARVVVSDDAVDYIRHDLTGGKLRTDVARVERVENLTGDVLKDGYSIRSSEMSRTLYDAFTYKTGMWVQTSLDEDVTTACSNGIHFFQAEGGAEDWWKQTCGW